MLRTFDELGYRQEQRFHFELGLLKLVHLRRLLPIEEVLSQFPVGGSGQGVSAATRGIGGPVAAARSVADTATSQVRAASVSATNAKPAFSPFEQDKNRSRFEEKTAVIEPVAAAQTIAVSVPVVESVEKLLVDDDAVALPTETIREEASAKDLQPSSLPSAESLQKASIAALISAKSQETAADAMADAEWVVEGGEVRVQTELSKTMLPMVINAEAERLIKAALRDAGAGALKLVLVPGVKTPAAAKKPRAVKTGSAQAMAMEHPIVQRAQTLFNAEIQSVIDLREND
jgi:DNA polymerase-3 subunit gamma/tau